jgi:hypothetical protein
MTLKSRLPKINQIAQSPTTRLIHKPNEFKKIYHADSVRTGKPYQVILEWSKNGTLILDVSLYTFDHKEATDRRDRLSGNHPANFNRTVCYQCLGTAKKMARENGRILSLCKDYQSAKKLLNFGGELVRIVNSNGGTVWATVR